MRQRSYIFKRIFSNCENSQAKRQSFWTWIKNLCWYSLRLLGDRFFIINRASPPWLIAKLRNFIRWLTIFFAKILWSKSQIKQICVKTYRWRVEDSITRSYVTHLIQFLFNQYTRSRKAISIVSDLHAFACKRFNYYSVCIVYIVRLCFRLKQV